MGYKQKRSKAGIDKIEKLTVGGIPLEYQVVV